MGAWSGPVRTWPTVAGRRYRAGGTLSRLAGRPSRDAVQVDLGLGGDDLQPPRRCPRPAQGWHEDEGFGDLRGRHLRRPGEPILESDGDLSDRDAGFEAAVQQLNEEGVSVGDDPVDHPPWVAAISRGAVVDADAEKRAAVHVGRMGQELTARVPANDRSSAHVARADHDTAGTPSRRQERAQMARLMRAVGIHGHQQGVAEFRAAPQAGDVGAPQSQLPGSVLDEDARVTAGETVGELPGPVWRVVVDHQHVTVLGANGQHEGLQVGPLVEGRKDDQRPTLRRDWGGPNYWHVEDYDSNPPGPAPPRARSRAPGKAPAAVGGELVQLTVAPAVAHLGEVVDDPHPLEAVRLQGPAGGSVVEVGGRVDAVQAQTFKGVGHCQADGPGGDAVTPVAGGHPVTDVGALEDVA